MDIPSSKVLSNGVVVSFYINYTKCKFHMDVNLTSAAYLKIIADQEGTTLYDNDVLLWMM